METALEHDNDRTANLLWLPDVATLELWPELTPGTEILVEKRDEFSGDGPVYPALIVETSIGEPWIEVRATWLSGRVDVSGLQFHDGDELREFFSPHHPFNAFALYSPDSRLKGWYANVTRPARCERRNDTLVVAWPDLILDLVMLPDRTVIEIDDEELAASGLPERDPNLTGQIVDARNELRRLLQDGFFPERSQQDPS